MSLVTTMKESGGFDLHEETEWYEGTITDIEETDGQFGAGYKFVINIDGEVFDDGNPRDTWAFCSQTLSPRSKLFKWAKGILGEAAMPTAGQPFDLGQMIGTRVKTMFEQYPGTDPDGNPTTKEKVVAIKAAGTPAAAPATAVAAAPAQPDPF